MNLDEIQQHYSKVMGNITNTMYHGGLEKLRNDGGLEEGERQHRAWNLYDGARDMARQATAERNEKLAERERSLKRKLFGAPSGGLVPTDASTKAAFTDAVGRAAAADDEALARMAAAAEHTGDKTLGKAVFAESHRRGHGDLMQRYLHGDVADDSVREAFGEFSQIPTAEEREQALDRVVRAIPEPTSQQIAPTQAAQALAQQENTVTRPMG